jgi:hypothetical protein
MFLPYSSSRTTGEVLLTFTIPTTGLEAGEYDVTIRAVDLEGVSV